MEILLMPQTLLTPIPRIADIIPVNEVTLLTALPGSGKSYTILKFLNINKIKPIYFNLDEDAALQSFSAYHFGKEFISAVLNQEVTDLKDQVIIIDHYLRLTLALDMPENTQMQQIKIAKQLEDLAHQQKCTVILIAHPEDYVGRSSIFKDNPYIVRNCAEHLHLDKIVSTKKYSKPEYRFYINKGRGIGGSTIHEDWFREPMLNPLTNQMC